MERSKANHALMSSLDNVIGLNGKRYKRQSQRDCDQQEASVPYHFSVIPICLSTSSVEIQWNTLYSTPCKCIFLLLCTFNFTKRKFTCSTQQVSNDSESQGQSHLSFRHHHPSSQHVHQLKRTCTKNNHSSRNIDIDLYENYLRGTHRYKTQTFEEGKAIAIQGIQASSSIQATTRDYDNDRLVRFSKHSI